MDIVRAYLEGECQRRMDDAEIGIKRETSRDRMKMKEEIPMDIVRRYIKG